MKSLIIIFFSMLLTLTASYSRADDSMAGDSDTFTGNITALDSNGYDPGKCFTAVDDNGIVKVFRVSSIDNLNVGDRVRLSYKESATYPLAAGAPEVVSSGGK